MKLYEIAVKALRYIQEAGPEGIHSIELIKKIGVPRRRIYDIIAVFSAANLIKVKKEKGGSRLFWIESLPSTSKKINQMLDLISKLRKEKETLTLKVAQLQQEIAILREQKQPAQIKTASDKVKFNTNKLRISAVPPHRITQVYSTGLDAFVEADGEGLVVKTIGKKQEKEQAVVT